MSRLRSLLIGVIASLATVIAVLAAGPVGLADVGFLVLVLPLGPGSHLVRRHAVRRRLGRAPRRR